MFKLAPFQYKKDNQVYAHLLACTKGIDNICNRKMFVRKPFQMALSGQYDVDDGEYKVLKAKLSYFESKHEKIDFDSLNIGDKFFVLIVFCTHNVPGNVLDIPKVVYDCCYKYIPNEDIKHYIRH